MTTTVELNNLDIIKYAKNGDIDCLKTLIDTVGDSIVNVTNNYGYTPLFWAVHQNQKKTVKLLLENHADQTIYSSDNSITSLYLAVDHEYEEIVKLLLSYGADPNISEKQEGNSPLITAVRRGNKKIIEILLCAGANINSINNKNETPLYTATVINKKEIVEMLLLNRADVTIPNSHGKTPLLWASLEGYFQIVEIILLSFHDESSRKSYVNKADTDGLTPLDWALRYSYYKTAKLLITAGADINLSDNIPLLSLSRRGQFKLVKLILNSFNKLSILNKTDNNNRTPLYIASCLGHIQIVDALIESGADINIVDKYNHTPLYVAAQKGHFKIVELILNSFTKLSEKILYINKANFKNKTPLYIAADKGSIQIVSALISNGADVNAADVNAADNGGIKPIHISKNEDIIILLMNHNSTKYILDLSKIHCDKLELVKKMIDDVVNEYII